MVRLISVCILICICCFKVYPQAKGMLEQQDRYVQLYARIIENLQTEGDSLEFYSEKFSTDFISLIKSNPATLNYSFSKLIDSNYCQIKTSSDGKFRIYSWDTWMGGTMHIFKEIYQWRGNDKVYTKEPDHAEGEGGSFCSKIFTVLIATKTYYLAITNGIYSTKDAMQSVSVYTIDNNRLIDTVKLFKTKTKSYNSIDILFDFFSVIDRPERPLELVTYDDKLKILYIPVVNEKSQVTDKNILYRLKGTHFEFIGIEKGRRK